MDLAELKVFEAVARLGGMNRAATELNTVQSNITARIRALEVDIGRPLFERRPRGVALTAAGRRLLPYALRVMRLVAEAGRAARDDGAPRGLLTIGSLETTAALRLTPLLAGYAANYPYVDLVLRTGTTQELIAATLEQNCDGAFVCGPVGQPELHEEVMFREELSLLAAPGVSSLDEALGGRSGTGEVQAVVLRAGCSYRQRLETLLARRGVTVRRHLEFGTLEAIFGCVAAGLGITLLSRALLGPIWAADRVSVHSLPPAEARVDTLFIRRREGFTSSALKAFLESATALLGTVEAA
jgi:LysR family transcriptional regulator, cell division regulator